MADLKGFNANNEPRATFDPIPAGKYLAIVIESELKKSEASEILKLTFEIIEGPYKGRKVWARLPLRHSNPKAQQIGRGQLVDICQAVGVLQPKDSVELHNLPLLVTVKVRTREDTGDVVNDARGFAKKPAPPSQPAQAQASTPPWRRP
jgi:hypothetical protein